jgi:hypothetical protein
MPINKILKSFVCNDTCQNAVFLGGGFLVVAMQYMNLHMIIVISVAVLSQRILTYQLCG